MSYEKSSTTLADIIVRLSTDLRTERSEGTNYSIVAKTVERH